MSRGKWRKHLCRTVVVETVKITRKVFNIFVKLEGMYRNIVEQLTMFAVSNNIRSFVRLKTLRYRLARDLYPHLPSHYVYIACQDASTRSKSFLRLKELSRARKNYPEVKRISIWLDTKPYVRIFIDPEEGFQFIEIYLPCHSE